MSTEQEQVYIGEKSGVKVEFKLGSLPIIELDRAEVDILGEVKMVLQENPYLKLTPNFHFNCKNIKLKEFESLSDQVDKNQSNLKINIVLENFNDRTARLHLLNLSEFFENPKHFIYQSFLDFNTLLGKNDYI